MEKKKILIVEDDANMLELVKTRLKSNDYEVISACNGSEGLEKIDIENPDLVLLDLKMPNMDGYTMLRKLREKKETRSIPVIVITGYEKLVDLVKMEGVKDILTKPFEDSLLLEKISKALPK